MERSYLSLILKIFIAALVTFVHLKAELCFERRFEKQENTVNLPISNSSVISSHHVFRDGECFLHCLRQPTCVAFKFKPNSLQEINCQLSNTVPEGIGKNSDKGWIYYLDVICANQSKDKKIDKCIFNGEHKTPNKTCSVMKAKYPGLPNGNYHINPEGIGSVPFPVYCDMTVKNGVGVTVIGHNSESKTKVKGYESAGSYKMDIIYDVATKQTVAIMNESANCEQFIEYQCHHSILLTFGWWVSRQGKKMDYWGGAEVGSGKCACGMTNSCVEDLTCNCKKNDYVLRSDNGFLTDKNTLPVKQLRFGDTGDSNEYGYHILGKLLCWG